MCDGNFGIIVTLSHVQGAGSFDTSCVGGYLFSPEVSLP